MFYFKTDLPQSKGQKEKIQEEEEDDDDRRGKGKGKRKEEEEEEEEKTIKDTGIETYNKEVVLEEEGKKKGSSSASSMLTNLYSYIYATGNVNTTTTTVTGDDGDFQGYTSPPPSLYYRSSYPLGHACDYDESSSSSSSGASSRSNSPLAAAEPNGDDVEHAHKHTTTSPTTTIFSRNTSPTAGFSARFSPLSAAKGMFFAPTCFVKIGQSLQEQMNSMQTSEKINSLVDNKEALLENSTNTSPSNESFSRDSNSTSKANSPKVNFFAPKMLQMSTDVVDVTKKKVEVDVDGFIIAKGGGSACCSENEIEAKLEGDEDSDSPKSYMFNTFVTGVYQSKKQECTKPEKICVNTASTSQEFINKTDTLVQSIHVMTPGVEESIFEGFSESTIIEKEDLLVDMRKNGFDDDGFKKIGCNIGENELLSRKADSSPSLIDLSEVNNISTIPSPSTSTTKASLWSTIFYGSNSADRKRQNDESTKVINGLINNNVNNNEGINELTKNSSYDISTAQSNSNEEEEEESVLASSSYASLLPSTSPLGMSASQWLKYKKEKERRRFM